MTSEFAETLLGVWKTKDGKDGLQVEKILCTKPHDALVGFVTAMNCEVQCNIIAEGKNDGQHNCGVWYKDPLVLKCLKHEKNKMHCLVMERVTPITQHIFGELIFAESLANTALNRRQYAANENEQDIYIQTVSGKVNGIRRKLAEAVHDFSLKNPGKVWNDFKFDNVGLDASGQVVLLDMESGLGNGNIQLLRNIEEWNVNGQYTLKNVLALAETKKTELDILLKKDRLDVEEFVRDKNPEDTDLSRQCYVIPPKFGNLFGMVLQWDLGIRVLLCDNYRNPIDGESRIFFDKTQAETYLRSRE